MREVRRVFIFGSTGSIGEKSLEVISINKDRFEVFGLSANSQIERLAKQAINFNVKVVVVPNKQARERFYKAMPICYNVPEVLIGENSLMNVASSGLYDIAIIATSGVAGLYSALEAAKSGKRILLANKELLVIAGQLFMDAVSLNKTEIIPIDSENNSIFQCLHRNSYLDNTKNEFANNYINKIILTDSGGPFRSMSVDQLEDVTPLHIYKYHNWQIGQKISVDSATMINKGFEIIETFWLFSMPIESIDILIQPQSIVHSMIEYSDGSVIANLSKPNMEIPISYALSFPDILENNVGFLDLSKVCSLDFFKPDLERFQCLNLSFEALNAGPGYCIVLNAANEVAVEGFLSGRLKYTWIPRVIEASFEWYSSKLSKKLLSLDEIINLDLEARYFASNLGIGLS
ncbi:1-deoxy-D-xylulose-5-phosphate reductoisomerase [Candidatus Kinetoplastidibacterium crithidiae]|uniref:1-deoxy-D-xylulose 5-phosphate reductoisomerase n=1 Tax=Candidatus Kinetoplastidibacterium crithidiae TCC036E TaxID=1208918 RepID=M1LWL7_9PROT|nr:1-deoxy-D-xylulose-5-phosphate reductoisomerase [Candidatus Kinetoplastibacterium crithidii]AFZ82735.1 1-deoxy-D-xylulose 5-phosphate reductoisomerase [Candidatus Kinetoplastibacterium crithidii (ex Angomonas deanei ATCC 30255)]AGF47614.1 1-deoxy-D-xylulose-5-phosphate reductoisomerase [Candidatus Kinetoplastibacterium crithidii TCC036E]